MNKFLTYCSSAALSFLLVTPGLADEHYPFLALVLKDAVNVRSGPNTNYSKIDQLNKGNRVVVLGRSYDWLKIQPLPTTKAYIRADYLQFKEGSNIASVTGDNVNVRSAASSDSASLGEITKGVYVKVLEQTHGWCRLAPLPGTTAWVNQEFLKQISSTVPAYLIIPAAQWSNVDSNNNQISASN